MLATKNTPFSQILKQLKFFSAKFFLLVLSTQLFLSCTEEKKATVEVPVATTDHSSEEIVSSTIPNTFNITLTSHTEGATYTSTKYFFGGIEGKVTSDKTAGNVYIEWQAFVNNVPVRSGYGGWYKTSKKNGKFEGNWTLNALILNDGVVNKVVIKVRDETGNSDSLFLYFDVDATAPVITTTTPPTNTYWTTLATLVFVGTAVDNKAVKELRYNNTTTVESGVIAGTNSWTQAINLNALENEIVLTSEDFFGNTRDFHYMVGRDNSIPTLTISTPTTGSTYYNNVPGPLTVTGLSSDVGGGIVSLTWSNSLTGQNGAITIANSWTSPPIPVVEGINTITITATDAAGNVQARSFDYELNLSSPIITQGTFDINEGAIKTTSKTVQVDLKATDYNTTITHLCLKLMDATPPLATDPCFVPIPAAQNLNLVDFPYTIGALSLNYRLIAFIKNNNNFVSVLANQKKGEIGTDIAYIDLDLGNPPEVRGVVAANTDSPSAPPTEAQLDSTAGPIIIKWNAYDLEGLAANPVDLSWTTDFKTFTSIATNQLNGNNGSCTIDHAGTTYDNGFTGCYSWNSGIPGPGTVFFVRVAIRDLDGQAAVAHSHPFNALNFNYIGGNIDAGLGVHASALRAYTNPEYVFNTYYYLTQQHSFVVNSKGEFFILDHQKGIIKVDPATGISSLYIARNYALSSNNGDNGNISLATLRNPIKLEVAKNNDLYILDYDRIRKIDYDTEIITTIAGGGVTTVDTIANPLSLRIGPFVEDINNLNLIKLPFTLTPNGDLYFASEYNQWYTQPAISYRVRKYNAATDSISSIRPSGIGTFARSTDNVWNCHLVGQGLIYDPTTEEVTDLIFKTYPTGACLESMLRTDPITYVSGGTQPTDYNNLSSRLGSLITGKNGKLYGLSRYGRMISVYNKTTNTWTNLFKGSNNITCSDGTVATSCSNEVGSLFVAADGTVYFSDYGAGIRRIDAEGKVQTVIGFKHIDRKDSFSSITAPLGFPLHTGTWKDGAQWKYSYLDGYLNRLIELNPAGNQVHLAGNMINSSPAVAVDARNTPLYSYYGGSVQSSFVQNTSNGNIYLGALAQVNLLTRSTLQWTRVIGAGATNIQDVAADGAVGTNVKFAGYGANIQGLSPDNNTLMLHYTYNSAGYKSLLKKYTINDSYRQSIFTNNKATAVGLNTWSPNATAVSSVYLPYHTYRGRMTYDTFTNDWLYPQAMYNLVHILPTGAGTKSSVTLSNALYAADIKHDVTDHFIYYCALNGNIYRRNVTASTEIQIPYPFPGMRCRGWSVHYNSERNSLAFAFEYHGMGGMAELMQ